MTRGDREAWFPRWLGPALLAVAFAGLAAWSWEKWADVQIDFGNELYIAWRLAEGDVLYRDIAHRQGPLPHYVNAAWFRAFGVSIRTLTLCNLALLAAICALVWRILRDACGRFTATAASGVLLCVFAFSQYLPIANYNYVAPYHHHQTHGLLLSLALIAALGRALRGSALPWSAVAGTCLGAVFLTKAEIFVPALGAALTGMALLRASGAPRRAAFVFAGFALLAPGAFFLLSISSMPAELAAQGMLGNWAHLRGVVSDPFYRAVSGLDAPAANLGRGLGAFAGLALFAGAVCLLDRALSRHERSGRVAALAAGTALFVALSTWPRALPWFGVARALPASSALAAAVLCVECLRRRADREALSRRGPLLIWAVWSTLLLAKVLLHARFDHYGFALAMPATLLLVAILLHEIPARLAPRGGAVARAMAFAALAAASLFFLGESNERYRRKDFPVGRGGDRVLAESPFTSRRPERIGQTLAWLEQRMPADSTLLVLPEGIGLNYWLRRRNSIPFNLFLPPELAAFGEPAVLAALERQPPDFVALMHRRTEEFAVGAFGSDPRNGQALLRWVRAHYRRVSTIGAEPFGTEDFGVVLFRRLPRRSP